MDKKKIILTLCLSLISLQAITQTKYNYRPLSNRDKQEIDELMFNRQVSSFLTTESIAIGPINFTNILNTLSYNPIEGTRIRLSVETNNKAFSSIKPLKNRLALSSMIAYGTKDNKIKYAMGIAFNFAKKPKSVYSFPCSTLSINWEDNTYSPTYPNYDIAYLSYGTWDRFYFATKQQLSASFLQEFACHLSLRPYAYYQKINSYILYDNEHQTELLDPNYDYINKAFGMEVAYSKSNNLSNIVNVLSSRYYSLPTRLSINYSYNIQSYKYNKEYSKLEAKVQHRFLFKPIALDFQIIGGAIFGKSNSYMYFTPNYMTSTVSNTFGFNIYSPYNVMFKEYLQTFTQINFGGILLDNIKYLRTFRPNEFINLKTLITPNNTPYMEVGIGIEHIFSFFGVEFVKRLSKENPYNMPSYAIKVRCNL